MIKKTITYTDFNGDEQVEDFYFNLTKAELVEMQFGEEGGFAETLQDIVDAEDNKELLVRFKAMLMKAYGVRSEDGKRFIKSEQLSEEFTQTAAYDELYFELATNAEVSAEFVNALMPSGLLDKKPVTASDVRAASEANMQGHRKPQNNEKATVKTVPELEASTPVLEAQNEEDLSSLTHEELVARLAAKK